MKANPLSRRKFLATTAATSAAVCGWEPLLSVCRAAAATGPRRLDLNGVWQVAQAGSDQWLAASVPGCVHTDLLAAGKIPDPFYRDNERAVQWVGEADWIYRRAFTVPEEVLGQDRVLLRCEGLDTLAVVKINGQEAGRADNMFRTWEFDLKGALQAGENRMEVLFSSPLPYIKKRQGERTLYEWAGPHEPRGRARVRKEPCNFGWDWGPVLITCGIWRDIGLEAFSQGRLSDVSILQDHSAKGRVELEVEVTAEILQAAQFSAAISVSHEGRRLGAVTCDLVNGKGRAAIELKHPHLWWPAGLGKQPLYEVGVELLDARHQAIDRTTRRIGLRTLKLLEKDDKSSLRFEVNGITFFAKGGNWIPADAFATRVTPAILRRYVADAVAVNMNVLRFWGGGYYEEDALYDACDEMGICVWVDFKFACSSYPAFDNPFMENVRREAGDVLRRLRHHPCIAVWCGNNEISYLVKDEWSDSSMGRADYDKLFKRLIGGEVIRLAPQANYVPGSPEAGDTHYWQVWHGDKPFEDYRSLNGFMSEFGFQSFPEPKTVRTYTSEEDRASVLTAVMEWHQRSAGNGNEKIRDMTSHYFRPPKDFESALWLSQIVQACGIQLGAEYWRQNMPKSMGCIFWQYNDCWPVASWSSVDYFGRWKALHYAARRFYAPVLVSALEDAARGTIDVFVTSDRLEPCHGKLTWNATDLDGKSLVSGSQGLEIAPRESHKVNTLDLHQTIQTRGSNGVLTWLKLIVSGRTVSESLVSFVAPKELALADPKLQTTVDKERDGFQVTIKAEKPALWVWLELGEMDARFSDNFMHVTAETPARVLVRPSREATQADVAQALRVRSLYDTYSAQG